MACRDTVAATHVDRVGGGVALDIDLGEARIVGVGRAGVDGGMPSLTEQRDDAGDADVKVRQVGWTTSAVVALDPSAAAVRDAGAVGSGAGEAETAHGLLRTGLEVADGEPEPVTGGVAVHESQPREEVARSPIEGTADTNEVPFVARGFQPAIGFYTRVHD